MRPILFPKNATTYTTNGIGRLDCMECEVVEERNGQFELSATIAETADHASEIENDMIIVAKPNQSGSLQPFRIYNITKPINGRFSVFAQHISYQLSYIPTMPFSVAADSSACSTVLSKLKSKAAEDCPFTFWTDVTTVASYNQTTPASIRQRLGGVEGSVLDQFGGEYEWDKWTVKLHKHRGVTTPAVSLRYGKNITDITQEAYISSVITGVCPFWVSSEGDKIVTLPEKVVESQYATNYSFKRTIPLDCSSDYENAPSAAELRAHAQAYVNQTGRGLPKVSIEVSFVALSDTEEYKDVAALQAVNLCDYVTVVFEKLGISENAKVVKTEYDVLKEKYKSIQIGTISPSFAQTISDTNGAIETVLAKAQFAVKNATAWLTGSNGYVIAVKNTDGTWKELIFADDNDPTHWHNLLRVNENGMGFSHDGGNTYSQAWTLDGKMVIGGTAAPSLTVYDSNNNILFQIDANGMQWNSTNSSMTTAGVLTMLAGAIKLGAISGTNPTEYNFTVNNNGTVTIKKGSINLGAISGTSPQEYNFSVNDNGTVTIKKGSINLGWDEDNDRYKFSVDNNGKLTAYSGTFAGNLSAAGGTFKGNLSAAGGTFSGDISAASGTFTGDLSGSDIRGGTIGIGGANNDQFTVDDQGNVTIKVGTLSLFADAAAEGGYRFMVDSNGHMKATGATLKNCTINGPDGVLQIQASNDDPDPDIRGKIMAKIDKYGVAGGFLTVMDGNGNVYGRLYGGADGGNEIRVSQTSRFRVMGNCKIDGNLEVNGVTAQSCSLVGSDRRIKKDIHDLTIEKAKNFIMHLIPREFRLRKDDGYIHHGFVAQEAEEVAEWGVVHEGKEIKAIAYNEIIADLVAVIQDQERRLAALEGGQNDKC